MSTANSTEGAKDKKINKSKKSRAKAKPLHIKAGLVFPVGRTKRLMRHRFNAPRVSLKAAISMATALEYLTAEILEEAGNISKKNKKKRINPRHIQLTILEDEELDKLFARGMVGQGGVLPIPKKDLLVGGKKNAMKEEQAQ